MNRAVEAIVDLGEGHRRQVEPRRRRGEGAAGEDTEGIGGFAAAGGCTLDWTRIVCMLFQRAFGCKNRHAHNVGYESGADQLFVLRCGVVARVTKRPGRKSIAPLRLEPRRSPPPWTGAPCSPQRTWAEKDGAQPLPPLCYEGRKTVAKSKNRCAWSESV
jgi:hypothetical protein